MGWTPNVNEAECDGCGYKELVLDKDDAPFWHDEVRITADGTEDRFLLCGLCHNKHVTHQRKADDAFEVFMKGLKR